LSLFRTLDLEFEPGSQFRYNNSDYVVLGAIIERVTKMPYEKVVTTRILEPLGMTDSGYDHHETILPRRASGYHRTFEGFQNATYVDMTVPYAAGSLYSTVDDLFRWDRALARQEPISGDSLAMMLKPNERNYGYGFFIWEERIVPVRRRVWIAAHSGHIDGFDSMIQRFIDDDHLIVLLNNTGQTNLTEIADNLKMVVYDAPTKQPRRPVAELLYTLMTEQGLNVALDRYRELRVSGSTDYDLSAGQLERLGRYLLERKRSADAIAVMEINAKLNWNNGWVYNSLGDAYREAGENQMALASYRRAITLDPRNSVISAKIQALVDE
jgi:tetratricopeptide (TPR) repeat protein